MWEYIVDDDDADSNFVYDTLDHTGVVYCYDRTRCRVLTPCTPEDAASVALAHQTRELPAVYHKLTLTREALLERMEQARDLETGDGHQMIDYLVLAYLNDPAITAAYRFVARYYE